MTEEILELLVWYLRVCSTGGRSLGWSDSYPNRGAFNQAVYRLRKAGLLVHRTGGETALALSPNVEKRLRAAHRPRRFWKRRWRGRWYVLVYDVPEKNRVYRDVLRGFLREQRMGCLQRSVYVAPDDIRPQYDDLLHGADVGAYACLFESNTVLGQEPGEIVARAWDMDELCIHQTAYVDLCAKNLSKVAAGDFDRASLELLVREEMAVYVAVMANDPLLPQALLPPDYRGIDAYEIHCAFVQTAAPRLRRQIVDKVAGRIANEPL